MSSKSRSSAAAHGGKPPRKKKKNQNPSPATEPISISISSLPYDLLLNCLSRVSRSYYPTLSLVSKQFRSIVSSPELYEFRSLVNRTECCLYLCLRYPRQPNTYWFTLIRKPNQTLTKTKSSSNLFIQIASPHLSPAQSTSLVSVGSNIYKIGGYMPSSSRVSVLDCRFNKWRTAPRMRMKRSSPSSSLLDGKIYVAGGCKEVSSSNWVEVFDPKTQTWGNLTNPGTERRDENDVSIVGIGGKLYLFGDEYVVYDPEECKWNSLGVDAPLVACGVHVCNGVVNDVLFFWYDGVFNWYDCKASLWKILNGCEGLPDFRRREYCKIVDFGGKMAVLWDGYVGSGCDKEKVIWCAEISLERRDGDEMWGKVEWFDVVLKLHWSCRLFDADVLSATV